MTSDLAPLIARLHKRADQHKYHHGHAVILSGGPGAGGAARLAARGALRVGAGLVTLGCPPAALAENAAHLDAVMLRPIEDGRALAGMLDDHRFNALCLGPGMGVERARDLVPTALGAGRTVVLDADALSAYGPDPRVLHALCTAQTVLTPHAGEFARLFPDLADAARADEAAATREAALRSGAVVLLKGAVTVIAAPDGSLARSDATGPRAAPWLATAGAGDVLAGIITGLLARGFAAFDAARLGSFLHLEAARAFGPGLIAEDLPDGLPGLLRNLLCGGQ
ncbi:NAD(P)H-hydrate dehydratase [Rhabdonatronobacter sediminivivens]|uniref:NAD(P)H-hydrate dehydratase n=1 Tax=Rhabdonatronobacter sediminivivens TaxID=2743469 RepID=UPI002E1760D1